MLLLHLHQAVLPGVARLQYKTVALDIQTYSKPLGVLMETHFFKVTCNHVTARVALLKSQG